MSNRHNAGAHWHVFGDGGVASIAGSAHVAATRLPLWKISTVRSVIGAQSFCLARVWGTE